MRRRFSTRQSTCSGEEEGGGGQRGQEQEGVGAQGQARAQLQVGGFMNIEDLQCTCIMLLIIARAEHFNCKESHGLGATHLPKWFFLPKIFLELPMFFGVLQLQEELHFLLETAVSN